MGLLPSLRQKKRYVVLEIVSEGKFSAAEVKEEVDRVLLQFWGELGLARSSPLFLKEKFSPEKQRFLLKINHQYVDELKAALTLSKKIKNKPVIIRSLRVSGTLKKASAVLS